MSTHKKQPPNIQVYKIIAQAVGLLVCMFFLLFIIGEGIPDIISGNGKELYVFLPILLFPVAGYIITWFKEKTGTAMIFAGALALLVYLLIWHDYRSALIYTIPFAVTGGLFLLHINKKAAHKYHK